MNLSLMRPPGPGADLRFSSRRRPGPASRSGRMAAGALVAALVASSAPSIASAQVPEAPSYGPQAAAPASPLTEPPVLRDRSPAPDTVEVSLTARVARRSLVPGVETEVWTYNGASPGPTLEVSEGDRVIVRFRNELPEETTVHWHGLHLPFAADGSPFHPVQPGEEYTYAFTVRPGAAGTYWYHPHPNHRTGWQAGLGLYGTVIVRAADDPLPASITERLLILSDNRFREDGSIDLPERHSPQGRVDFENGREGDVLFVNGQIRPSLSIRSGEVQRWRVVNASPGRYYRIAIPGQSFLHVGNDGGLFERPVEVEEILLASAERVEILVRGTGPPGSRGVLQALPYDRYIPQTRPADWDRTRDLLTLEYSAEEPVAPVAIPETLRAVPPLDPAEATATRLMVLTQGFINGRPMELDRVDVSARLGATEIWRVENLVGMDHPFHLHGFQFQVLTRNGVPEPFRSWKDVVNVPKHETARFIVRYDGYPGKWMFHCHILDHEDNGMMGILEVREPAVGLPDGPVTEAQVLRGRRLVLNHDCGACHGGGVDPAADGWLAGDSEEPQPVGEMQLWPRNLTPDDETGLGRVSERQIFNALRYGLRPGETPDVEITSPIPGEGNHPANPDYLGPGMPWVYWRFMSDQELWDIAAYLTHGLEPVTHAVPESDAPPDRWASEFTVEKIGPPVLPPFPTAHEELPEPEERERVLRGRKLVASAACSGCHGEAVHPGQEGWLSGMTSEEQAFQIGPFTTRPRNLTPHNTTGMGRFSERQIFNALRYGLRPGETADAEITSMSPGEGNFPLSPKYLAPPMPWPAWRYFSDRQLWDIAAYLKHGVKPVENRVPDSEGPPDFWVRDYGERISPYPPPPFPTANERRPEGG